MLSASGWDERAPATGGPASIAFPVRLARPTYSPLITTLGNLLAAVLIGGSGSC
jgi:hypothetical protein